MENADQPVPFRRVFRRPGTKAPVIAPPLWARTRYANLEAVDEDDEDDNMDLDVLWNSDLKDCQSEYREKLRQFNDLQLLTADNQGRARSDLGKLDELDYIFLINLSVLVSSEKRNRGGSITRRSFQEGGRSRKKVVRSVRSLKGRHGVNNVDVQCTEFRGKQHNNVVVEAECQGRSSGVNFRPSSAVVANEIATIPVKVQNDREPQNTVEVRKSDTFSFLSKTTSELERRSLRDERRASFNDRKSSPSSSSEQRKLLNGSCAPVSQSNIPLFSHVANSNADPVTSTLVATRIKVDIPIADNNNNDQITVKNAPQPNLQNNSTSESLDKRIDVSARYQASTPCAPRTPPTPNPKSIQQGSTLPVDGNNNAVDDELNSQVYPTSATSPRRITSTSTFWRDSNSATHEQTSFLSDSEKNNTSTSHRLSRDRDIRADRQATVTTGDAVGRVAAVDSKLSGIFILEKQAACPQKTSSRLLTDRARMDVATNIEYHRQVASRSDPVIRNSQQNVDRSAAAIFKQSAIDITPRLGGNTQGSESANCLGKASQQDRTAERILLQKSTELGSKMGKESPETMATPTRQGSFRGAKYVLKTEATDKETQAGASALLFKADKEVVARQVVVERTASPFIKMNKQTPNLSSSQFNDPDKQAPVEPPAIFTRIGTNILTNATKLEQNVKTVNDIPTSGRPVCGSYNNVQQPLVKLFESPATTGLSSYQPAEKSFSAVQTRSQDQPPVIVKTLDDIWMNKQVPIAPPRTSFRVKKSSQVTGTEPAADGDNVTKPATIRETADIVKANEKQSTPSTAQGTVKVDEKSRIGPIPPDTVKINGKALVLPVSRDSILINRNPSFDGPEVGLQHDTDVVVSRDKVRSKENSQAGLVGVAGDIFKTSNSPMINRGQVNELARIYQQPRAESDIYLKKASQPVRSSPVQVPVIPVRRSASSTVSFGGDRPKVQPDSDRPKFGSDQSPICKDSDRAKHEPDRDRPKVAPDSDGPKVEIRSHAASRYNAQANINHYRPVTAPVLNGFLRTSTIGASMSKNRDDHSFNIGKETNISEVETMPAQTVFSSQINLRLSTQSISEGDEIAGDVSASDASDEGRIRGGEIRRKISICKARDLVRRGSFMDAVNKMQGDR